jgi:hypothetical protein
LTLAAGYEVKPEKHGTFVHDTAQIDWEAIEKANPQCYQGIWNEPQADALIYLIAHSDCDGVLRPQEAAPLADRIEGLLDAIPDREDWHRAAALRFVAGLRDAVAKGEDVDFH